MQKLCRSTRDMMLNNVTEIYIISVEVLQNAPTIFGNLFGIKTCVFSVFILVDILLFFVCLFKRNTQKSEPFFLAPQVIVWTLVWSSGAFETSTLMNFHQCINVVGYRKGDCYELFTLPVPGSGKDGITSGQYRETNIELNICSPRHPIT